MNSQSNPLRLAMWSPPRARSTMMMRVFEALAAHVIDEPFYAYWLKRLRKTDDPGYEITLASHETDWRKIVDSLFLPIPDNCQWQYQKHMAIHMLEEVSLDWMADLTHCFLIRHPAEVIVSMSEFRSLSPGTALDLAAAADLVGIPQLQRIFDRVCELTGEVPLVIDANDLLADPANLLTTFCTALDIPYDPAVPITWEPGRHPYDGAWADDWYQKVYETTGLEPYTPKEVSVPASLQPVVDYCLPTYKRLAQYKLSTN